MSGSVLFGQKAKELLLELKRSDWLPNYNDEGVRQTVEEIRALYEKVRELSGEEESSSVSCSMVTFHSSAMRNKRCLLAYLKHRAHKLVELRWQSGSAIPPEFKSKLSADELQFFEEYDSILSDYMREVDVDLTADQQPPKHLYIEVRVLEDCGDILTSSGSVNLQKNTTHFLRRADVEHLIRQGFLEQVN